MKCEDCQDTGYMETEGVILGRPYMKDGKLVTPYTTDGNWQKTICHCKSDEE